MTRMTQTAMMKMSIFSTVPVVDCTCIHLLIVVVDIRIVYMCIDINTTPTLEPLMLIERKSAPLKKAKWHLGMFDYFTYFYTVSGLRS